MKMKTQKISIQLAFCIIFFMANFALIGCQTHQNEAIFTPEFTDTNPSSPPISEVTTTQTPTPSIYPTATELPSVTSTFPPISEVTTTQTPTPSIYPTVTGLPSATPTLTVVPTLHKLEEIPLQGTTLDISLDGNLILVSDPISDVLSLYNVVDKNIVWQFSDPNAGGMTGYPGIISPDKTLVAVTQTERDLYILNAQTGTIIYQIDNPYEFNINLSFSSDGQLLALSSSETYNGPAITIYSMQTGEVIDQFTSPSAYKIEGGEGQEIEKGWYIWDVTFLPHRNDAMAIMVQTPIVENPDDSWAMYFWDIESQQIQQFLHGDMGWYTNFSQDGSLVTTTIDHKIYVLDNQSQKIIFEKNLENVAPHRTIISNEGYLAYYSRKKITIWNIYSESQVELSIDDLDKIITDVKFTPTGQLVIAYLSDQGTLPLELWDIK